MTDYVTEQEMLDYIGSAADTGNANLSDAITAASRAVEAHCARVFTVPTATETFYYDACPGENWKLEIDDLANTTGLVVKIDSSADGTYATTLTLNTQYVLEPRNQTYGGLSGWPYTWLRGRALVTFPYRTFVYQPETVQVTGQFGWPATPDAVKQATKIVAAQYFKLADAPLGVAGWGAFGDIRVRDVPQAATLLAPYRKGESFGIA